MATPFRTNPIPRLPVPNKISRSTSGGTVIASSSAARPSYGCRARRATPNLAASLAPRDPGAKVARASLGDPRRAQRAIRADVAQLVEQLIRNQQVAGSNPAVGSVN